jgi:hypothetical protein
MADHSEGAGILRQAFRTRSAARVSPFPAAGQHGAGTTYRRHGAQLIVHLELEGLDNMEDGLIPQRRGAIEAAPRHQHASRRPGIIAAVAQEEHIAQRRRVCEILEQKNEALVERYKALVPVLQQITGTGQIA